MSKTAYLEVLAEAGSPPRRAPRPRVRTTAIGHQRGAAACAATSLCQRREALREVAGAAAALSQGGRQGKKTPPSASARGRSSDHKIIIMQSSKLNTSTQSSPRRWGCSPRRACWRMRWRPRCSRWGLAPCSPVPWSSREVKEKLHDKLDFCFVLF